jgi:hypothetical protein
MSNTNLTVDMITRAALKIAHEKCTFIGTTDRQYDDSYASSPKIGSTLRVRLPNQYTRRQGSRVMDVQDQNELKVDVTLATQDGVDMRFNSAELALEIEDFSKRYIEPAMSVLVSGIEADYLAAMTKATYNYVGSAGNVVGASADISAIFNARAKLNQYLAPKDRNRAMQMDSVTMGTCANGLKGLFLPSDQVAEAFREGFYARTAMADLYENERTWTLANGSDVTANTDAAALVTDGGTALDFHTLGAQQSAGQIFTIAGVYACHPETKQAYSHLQQFTIVTANNSGASVISPPTYLTGPRKNVVSATGATLATTDFDAKTLTFYGSASTSYRQNLMYHKDAFAFVTADLPIMGDASKCVRREKDGLSLRVWEGSDIRNDEHLMRIDILYGFKAIRPEWACRVNN